MKAYIKKLSLGTESGGRYYKHDDTGNLDFSTEAEGLGFKFNVTNTFPTDDFVLNIHSDIFNFDETEQLPVTDEFGEEKSWISYNEIDFTNLAPAPEKTYIDYSFEFVNDEITLTEEQFIAADVNKDGVLTSADSRLVQSMIGQSFDDAEYVTLDPDIERVQTESDVWMYAPKEDSTCEYGKWSGRILALTEKVNGTDVTLESKYGFRKLLILDLTDVFDSDYDVKESDVKQQCENYISTNTEIRRPKVSLSVKFQPHCEANDAGKSVKIEKIGLCDTVRVIHDGYGIDKKLKVNKTVYNVLTEKYKSIEIGDAKSSFADTIRSYYA